MTDYRFAAAALAVLALASAPVAAQPPTPGPIARPAFSPYLNLLRPGNSPALNYFGLVRPEQSFRQTFQAVQSAVTTNQRTLADLARGGELGQTGAPAQFQNHLGFFQNQQSAGFGVGARGLTGGGGPGRR